MTLGLVAAHAPHVRLGASVIILPMRNPVLLAKQAAAIDLATNGRFILGVGTGWNAREYANLGADFRTRGKRLDEGIALLRALWSQENVQFAGQFTQIEDGHFAPPPVRRDIPIWIGGNGEPSWRRAARLGDGWHATGASAEEMAQGLARIRELGPARPITVSVRVSIDFDPAVSRTFQYRGSTRYRLAGVPEAIRGQLWEHAQAGVEQMVLVFPWDKDLAAAMEQMHRFAQELMPQFS